jgi:hypothetical protein
LVGGRQGDKVAPALGAERGHDSWCSWTSTRGCTGVDESI